MALTDGADWVVELRKEDLDWTYAIRYDAPPNDVQQARTAAIWSDLFRAYVEARHAAENLHFLDDLDEAQEATARKRIYDKYFSPQAEEPIPVDDDQALDALRQAFDVPLNEQLALPDNVFDRVKGAVLTELGEVFRTFVQKVGTTRTALSAKIWMDEDTVRALKGKSRPTKYPFPDNGNYWTSVYEQWTTNGGDVGRAMRDAWLLRENNDESKKSIRTSLVSGSGTFNLAVGEVKDYLDRT